MLTAANARHAWGVLKDRGNVICCREADWLAYPPTLWMCHHEIHPLMAEEKCDCCIVLFIEELARRRLIDGLPMVEAVAKLHCLAFKKFLSLLSLDSLRSSSSLLVISTKISCSVYSLCICKNYTICSLFLLPIEALI